MGEGRENYKNFNPHGRRESRCQEMGAADPDGPWITAGTWIPRAGEDETFAFRDE
jgi:hypothetical protein